jgi:hypothetical protein
VIDSLDAQLAKLDVGRALDAGDRAELNQVLNRRRQLEAKRKWSYRKKKLPTRN